MFDQQSRSSVNDSKEIYQRLPHVVMDVEQLSYTPPPLSALNRFREYLIGSDMMPQMLNDRMRKKLDSAADGELFNVSFRAMSGKVTGVLSQEPAERKALMELIAGRRTHGVFDGEVTLLEDKASRNVLQLNNSIAYVPRVSLITF